MDMFVELAVIILVATGISFLMKALKQPFIVGYILSGILVGPYFLNILHSEANIELFSKLGITILLFIVGLNLNPTVIQEIGRISILTGLGQVIFTSITGFLVCVALGLDMNSSFYVAVALTFSSTIIILKLLSDKGDLEKLYAKIAIGLLLIQDIVATITLILITTFSGGNTSPDQILIITLLLVIKGLSLGVLLYLANRVILPIMFSFIASSQELLFIFSIAWGMIIASLAHTVGFSMEIGALIAGVTLSTTAYSSEIASRMKPLRDFFVLLFFILLGSQMALDTFGEILIPATILSLFVLIGNPIIMIVLMNLIGYKRKTGFLAGLTVAQISEFSLILATLGVTVGHITNETLSLITLVGLITISVSSYFIIYSESFYHLFEKSLKFLELRQVDKEKGDKKASVYDIILFGYDRVGYDFVKAIASLEKNYLVVDYNPKSIKRLKSEDIPNKYGDAEDVEFLDELNLAHTKLVISTIPDVETNRLLVQHFRRLNPHAIAIVLSHDINHAKELYGFGASYVVMPHFLGAEFASHLIKKYGLDEQSFKEEREKHLKKLSKRLQIG